MNRRRETLLGKFAQITRFAPALPSCASNADLAVRTAAGAILRRLDLWFRVDSPGYPHLWQTEQSVSCSVRTLYFRTSSMPSSDWFAGALQDILKTSSRGRRYCSGLR